MKRPRPAPVLLMATLSAGLGLSACAKKAELIEPAAISPARYDGWSCRKMKKELTFVEEALVRKSATQDRAADQDALMVFLIGVPTSGGGIAGEVARLKGEREALHRAMTERGCRI